MRRPGVIALGFFAITLSMAARLSFAAETAKLAPVNIRMWTSYDGGKRIENEKREVDISGLYFDGLEAFDIQYEVPRMYKGIRLRDLISQYTPVPQSIDYVLLHSKRGMIIPVDIRLLRKDTDVFIALATRPNKKAAWSTEFESSVYAEPNRGAKIPLQFSGNKMVVGKNWRHTDFAITPWRFFDSLAGIEFVSSQGHYTALDPNGQSSEGAGRSVYMRRCQYCHAVGSFGATFAPDFLKLTPASKDIAVQMVMNKVLPTDTPRPAQAKKAEIPKIARMPKQTDFTKKEAEDLVHWIHSLQKKP